MISDIEQTCLCEIMGKKEKEKVQRKLLGSAFFSQPVVTICKCSNVMLSKIVLCKPSFEGCKRISCAFITARKLMALLQVQIIRLFIDIPIAFEDLIFIRPSSKPYLYVITIYTQPIKCFSYKNVFEMISPFCLNYFPCGKVDFHSLP